MKRLVFIIAILFIGSHVFGQDSEGAKFPCLENAEFSNAITPNNDGKNDFFSVNLDCNPSKFSFSVYDRWGEHVYQSDNIDFKWHGKDMDKNQLPAGVYVWVMMVTIDGIESTQKSDITLLY